MKPYTVYLEGTQAEHKEGATPEKFLGILGNHTPKTVQCRQVEQKALTPFFAESSTISFHRSFVPGTGFAVRILNGRFGLAPGLLEKMFENMAHHGLAYSFCDLSDLGLPTVIEIVDTDMIDNHTEVGILPDGSLDLNLSVPSRAHLIGSEHQHHYYQTLRDSFYAYPKGINIEPAAVCNLRCMMCPYNSPRYGWRLPAGTPPLMSPDLYSKIIHEIASWPQKPQIELCYRGEPLMQAKLPEMIKKAAELGISVSLVTNGTLLTPEMNRKLLNSGVQAITVSIDTVDPVEYEKIRRGAKLSTVMANTLDLVEQRNDEALSTPLYVKAVKLHENPTLHDGVIDAFVDKVSAVMVQTEGIPGNHAFDLWANPQTEAVLQNRYPCHLLWMNLLITTAGNVSSCLVMKEERENEILGNVLQNTLLEIWRGDRLAAWQDLSACQEFSRIPLCGRCSGVSCSFLLVDKRFYAQNIFVKRYGEVDIYTYHG